ncbi:Na(+)/H(+) antiporter subunit A [Pseudoruegeria aquimaris]|uniref:Na(+)/H(+) antiporter subunit A n=1 Tax=Pseudoruegeria aquimaris TaxID=393663 RepID=A0A1Y5R9S9_9RHOB|nr:putative monovalent cation/H+ antiporter subunit A [Pseudoruegeria aquimaris]SLN12378.1 Na(+)/H(+) antiporter subunit A [Pseudoruegeria aquimaris]
MAAGHDEAKGNGFVGWLPVLLSAGIFAFFLQFLPQIAAGDTLRVEWAWAPSLGVALSFLVDGLSLTFALLISGIGTFVLLYSNSYLAGHPQYGRFALYLFSFMLSMLGLVLSDNLIGLFVFWELTTLTSYLLIGFDNESPKARRSALQALLLTGAGGLAMLAGLILLGAVGGSFEISQLVPQAEAIKGSGLYVPILILILAGTFTKSAQVPFHFWLPNAMAAPTPVSAFLHSATMVKAGVYLMARLHPVLSGTELWFWTLTIFGAVTAVFTSVLSLRQDDLKQALAYSTLMALGTLTMLLAPSSGYAITAFATFLVVHSLYKAALFLVVGCVDHGTGTRDADLLGGLARFMPFTAFTAALAGLSMAGLPPFIGYIGKELIYANTITAGDAATFVTVMALAANALMFAVAGVVALRPFWGKRGDTPLEPHEAPWPMLAGPMVLALLGLAFGLMPLLAEVNFTTPTVAAILGDAEKAKHLHLWAGVNTELMLSLATFAIGGLLLALYRPVRRFLEAADAATPSFDNGWDNILDALYRAAKWQTGILQSGNLQRYLFTIFATFVVAVGGTLLLKDAVNLGVALDDMNSPRHWPELVLIVAAALVTASSRSRMLAVAALGVQGIAVALIFISFGAPDVAITQLLVETLVVVLVAVAMLSLPFLDERGKNDRRPKDMVLAVLCGVVVSAVLIGVLQGPLDLRLTDFFETTAAPEAFGRNIVNVILVDFRAIDTFGEIAVIVVAALSAYALLRTTDSSRDRDEEEEELS